MRPWVIVSVVLSTVGAAAIGMRRLAAPPAVRETSDVTAYGESLATTPGQAETATFAAGCF